MNKFTKTLLSIGIAAAIVLAIPGVAGAVTNSSSVIINPADPSQAPKISSALNGKVFDTTRPKLSGTTFPNSRVDIYIYSDPIHGVTYSDAKGYWEWTPDVDIPAGQHTAQATVTDSKGNKSMASVAYTFEISANAAKDVAGAQTKATTNWVTYAIWGLVVVFLLVGGYAITRRRKLEE